MTLHRPRLAKTVIACVVLASGASFGQVPSARLQVSASSGFLGLGSPRYVTVSLSTVARDSVLTSEQVNGSALTYFLLKPIDGWLPDDDFFAAVVPTLRIRQRDFIQTVESMSPLSQLDSTLLVGFSKSVRLDLPMEFMVGLEDEVFTTLLEVPSELWPGYPRLEGLTARARADRQSGSFRSAVASIDSALLDPSLKNFPQRAALMNLRTTVMVELANAASSRLDSTITDPSLPLDERVAAAAQSAESLRFAADSLQVPGLGMPPADQSIVTLAVRIRSQAARAVLVRDSLQQQFDLSRIGWILDKGTRTKNGLLHSTIVEAVAYGFSSVDVLDTTQRTFEPVLPERLARALDQEDLMDDFRVFVRMCNDRYRYGVPIFPVEFLPVVRRDTSQHSQPVYYMLQGISDYWMGNMEGARAASFAVLRRTSDTLVLRRYDLMRMVAEFRLGISTGPGMEALALAQTRLMNNDTLTALAVLDAESSSNPIAPVAVLRGNLAVGRGDTVGALGQYASAWLTDRRTVDAYLRAAMLLRSRGELQRAVELLHLALDAGNEYWMIYYWLGMFSLEKGDAPGAMRALMSALEIAPRSYEATIGLGRANQASGDLRRARELYNRAITINPLRTEAVDLLTVLNRLNRPPR